jgi:hypothetical protein
MSNLLKALFPGRSGQALKPLVLSNSLCHALTMVSHIFGQSWDVFVVGELRLLLREPSPPEGTRLKAILTTLIRQSSLANLGLADRFIINSNQIRYKTLDRRYTVVILQGEGDTILLSWQMSARGAGSSFISYTIKGNVWTCSSWDVSEECQKDLPMLAGVGGEVLGFLAEHDLLPAGSFFIKALEAHMGGMSALRERATAAKE